MSIITGSHSPALPPVGPDGARRRIEEIRTRLAEFSGSAFDELVDTSESGLAGAIGAAGLRPLDPFGPGQSVSGMAPPNLKEMIREAALRNGLDPVLFDALVESESAYSPAARSRVGAMGLTQLMPGTAQELGVTDPFDPVQSLNGGAKYLRQMLTKFGSIEHALAAYNAGPGAVLKHGGIPPYAETRAYVDKVMRRYSEGRGQ